jgi:hypothetical protein
LVNQPFRKLDLATLPAPAAQAAQRNTAMRIAQPASTARCRSSTW